MPLVKINIAPGVNKEAGSYGAEGFYNDSDKVRFFNGIPEKIKGWQKFTTSTITGICRGLGSWLGIDNVKYLAVGTHSKLHVFKDDEVFDITPSVLTSGQQHNTDGLGYGSGKYEVSSDDAPDLSTRGWSDAAKLNATTSGATHILKARTWSFAFFGDHLIACP